MDLVINRKYKNVGRKQNTSKYYLRDETDQGSKESELDLKQMQLQNGKEEVKRTLSIG